MLQDWDFQHDRVVGGSRREMVSEKGVFLIHKGNESKFKELFNEMKSQP